MARQVSSCLLVLAAWVVTMVLLTGTGCATTGEKYTAGVYWVQGLEVRADGTNTASVDPNSPVFQKADQE